MTSRLARAAWLVLAWGMRAAGADPAERPEHQWPHWRGPHADGTAPATNPPLRWDERTHVAWKVPLPGTGSATPIIWGDRVFVLAAVPTERLARPDELPRGDPNLEKRTTAPDRFYRFEVLCFDRATGKLRWQRTAAERVPHEGHHETHSYAGGSPTTDGQRLYVCFGSFGVYCYDLDGQLLWSRDLGRLATRLGWGEAVTPVLADGKLLLNWDQEVDSALHCLDARTGATLWRAARDERTSWNTPLVVSHQGQKQVIVNGTQRIRAHDLATGKEIWQCGGMTTNPIPSPVAKGGVVYCLSGYRGSAALAIALGGQGDLTGRSEVLWRHDRGTPYVPSPLLLGDRLLFTQANQPLLTILDIHSGKPILDRERLPTVKSFYASPLAAAGRVYLTDRDGTTLVLRAGDRLEILATNRLHDPIDASPAAVGKQLFLRARSSLYCLEEPGPNP